MDLLKLVPTTDTIEVELKHPNTFEPLKNDDGSIMTIVVFAPHSKEYKAAMHEQTNIRLKQMQTKGGRSSTSITAEDLEESGIKMLVKTTKSWNITAGGKKPKLTDDEAKKIYSEVFWIKDQIEEAVLEAEVFT